MFRTQNQRGWFVLTVLYIILLVTVGFATSWLVTVVALLETIIVILLFKIWDWAITWVQNGE